MGYTAMDFKALSKILITISLSLLLSACGGDGESDSRVVISGGDTIIVLNDLQYQWPMVVQVADSDGSPQANFTVSISLKTTGYLKGQFFHTDIDIPPDDTTDKWVQTIRLVCDTEDINNNIMLDAGEDTNGNGLLDPDTPSLTPHDGETPTFLTGTSTLVTDDNGFGYFTVSYPKTQATWVSVQITATVEDGLAENRSIEEFRLPASKVDINLPDDDAPAFVVSPYGSGFFSAGCTDTL